MTQTRSDVVTVLTDDHRAVEHVFRELESRQGDMQHRRALTDHVIAELVGTPSPRSSTSIRPLARRCPMATRWPTTRSPSTPRPSAR